MIKAVIKLELEGKYVNLIKLYMTNLHPTLYFIMKN
jgi:hypothetical protein